MTIDRTTVQKIAKLARIRVEDKDLDGFARELNGIMQFAAQLNELDTDNVKPLSSMNDAAAALRPDVINDGGDARAVLQNAPDAAHGFFLVPKVVE